MKYVCSLLCFCLIVITTGCLPEPPVVNPARLYDSNSSLNEDFEAFWNGMNNNYAFWDIDPTDWDAIYRKYKPLFVTLGSDQEDYAKAYTYYTEMTAKLIDSHYSMTFIDELATQGFDDIRPAVTRLLKRPGIHNYIPSTHYTKTVTSMYLTPGSRTGYSPDSSLVIIAGTIRNTNILYFRFPEFKLAQWYESGTATQKETIQYVLDKLSQSTTEGLILDVRGNRGGDVPDMNFLMGRLVDKPYVYGQYRAKASADRLDYLPWVNSSVYPPTGGKAFTKPVVVLADMLSVSMAEATAAAVKSLPNGNGKVVGERTFGALSPLTPASHYNAGSFSTPYLKAVTTVSMMYRYKDGICYEGVGFPPDVEVLYDAAGLRAGKDTQLETAIRQIR